jgi:hypothetical protein
MTLSTRPERAAWVASALLVLFFGALLLILPAFALGFDEAKYLGIGANTWAGNGPKTVFGLLFLPHAPLWSALVYAPQALLGLDALSWGHLLDGIAGMAVLALTAIMGSWSRPAAAVLGVAAMLGYSYLLQLTRTTRLDVPVAALALLYLVVGWRAVRTGSARWAAGAGIVFAVAVLVKEVALPLAPVPFLCGILADLPWRRLFRTAGWTALLGALGLTPWFLYYAAETGHVYRLETPAWTFPLLLAPIVALVAIGLAANRLAEWPRLAAASARLRGPLPGSVVVHARTIVGWGIALAWSAGFLYFFSRIGRLGDAPFFQVSQYRLYLRTWLLELLPIGVFVASGMLLALALLLGDRGARERRGVVNALVATVCGAPIVLMVVAVGEPPRNYIAQVATASVVAAGAWVWAVDRIAARLSRSSAGRRRLAWVVPGMLVLAIVCGTGAVSARAWLTRSSGGALSIPAIRATVDWVRANVPRGTPLAFGSYLSYEMAYQLVSDYPTRQIPARLSMVNPAMPLALTWGTEPAVDWVAVDTAPRNVNDYMAFRADWVESDLRRFGTRYWIYTTGVSTSSPMIKAQLTPEHGFDVAASWDFRSGDRGVNVTIYRVNLDRVALDRSRLYISPEALARLVNELETTPAASKAAAAALLQRIVVVPPASSAEADLARLRALAQP